MLGSSAFAEFPGKSVPNRCQDYGCVLCCPATPVKTSHCQSQGRKSANQHDRCKCCEALAKPQLPPPPPTEKQTSHHPTKNATFTWNPVILQLLQFLFNLQLALQLHLQGDRRVHLHLHPSVLGHPCHQIWPRERRLDTRNTDIQYVYLCMEVCTCMDWYTYM